MYGTRDDPPLVRGDDAPITTADQELLRVEVASVLQAKLHRRNFVGFWLLGFLNNYYYCVVLSASESIAEGFGLKSLTALVSWSLIVGGILIRSLNAFVFNHIGYNWRILFFAIQAVVGVVLVCIAPYCGDSDGFRFALSLLGIFSIGNASSYGESAMLGYLDRFPSATVGAWSSGTGLSGVAAALVYLGLQSAGLSNTFVFLVNVPAVAFYALSFYLIVSPILETDLDAAIAAATRTDSDSRSLYALNHQPAAAGGAVTNAAAEGTAAATVARAVAAYRKRPNWKDASQWGKLTCRPPRPEEEEDFDGVPARGARTSGGGHAVVVAPADSAGPLLAEHSHAAAAEAAQPPASGGSCLDRCLRCVMPGTPPWAVKMTHRAVFSNCVNLMLVYIFEYGVQFMAPYSFPGDKDHAKNGEEYDWATQHAFVLSQFSYQIGVLMSRSSLSIVRIRRVWILSLIQGINYIVWIAQGKTRFFGSDESRAAQAPYTALLLVYMVGVGLLGGASYVNVFYNILNDEDPTGTAHKEEITTTTSTGENGEGEGEEEGGSGNSGRRGSGRASSVIVTQPLFNFKELAMNIGALYATAGITGGTLLDVIVANTLI
jgi:battenin